MRNILKLPKIKRNKNIEHKELTEVDIQNNEICKKALKMYLIGIIITIIANLIFPRNFFVLYFLNLIIIFIFSKTMFMITGDDEVIKNSRVLIYAGITNKTFAFALTMESIFSLVEFPISYLFVSVSIINIIYFFLLKHQMKLFMRDSSSTKIRNSIIRMYLIGYLMSVLFLNSFWLMIIIIPVMTAYSIFEDVRLITISSVIANIIAVIASLTQVQYYDTNAYASIADVPILINNLMSGKLSDRTLHMFWIYMLILAFFALYTIVMVQMTKSVKKFNADKIEAIEVEQSKMGLIVDKIMEIGVKIKSNAFYTQKYIAELDETSKESAKVLAEVSSDNIANIDNVNEQSDMSDKITELINDVVKEVDKASVTTKNTINGLGKSREAFNALKVKSNMISKNNEEIKTVINDFVDEARRVKNITSGIEYLLDETNLLSFNTFIRSAKDKEVGKGFEVIAGEIFKLAGQTYSLTENINILVEKLEKNALLTHEVINDVVEEINEENQNIDKTMDEFNNMEYEIYELGENINEISNRVNYVTEFNKEIENHIKNLKELSAQISNSTNIAGSLNEESLLKIKEANEIMIDMMGRAEKLEEYYYMKGL